MPQKGDLVIRTGIPAVVYEIVRITDAPVTAVLLGGGPGAYTLTEVPQSSFSLYEMYVPPIVRGQLWADEDGRTFEVFAVVDFKGVSYVAFSPVDENALNVATEVAFRQRGTLVV